MGRPRRNGKNAETRALSEIQDLRDFEEFRETIAPALRAAVRDKAPSEDILELVRSHAVARLASIALMEEDSLKALSAIEKVLQRTDGPIIQKTESEHRFGKLPEDQIDALIKTKLSKSAPDESV